MFRSAAAGAHRIAERPLCAGVCRARCEAARGAALFWCCHSSARAATMRWRRCCLNPPSVSCRRCCRCWCSGRVRRARWRTMSRSIRRGASTRRRCCRRLVRLAEGAGKGESQHVHTMLLSAPYGQMLASKRYSRTAENPTPASLTASAARFAKTACVRWLICCRRIHAARAAQRLQWCVARGGGCLRAVASSQRTGHSGRASRGAPPAGVRDRRYAGLCHGARLPRCHHGQPLDV